VTKGMSETNGRECSAKACSQKYRNSDFPDTELGTNGQRLLDANPIKGKETAIIRNFFF